MKKTILPPTACLASFFCRDNFVITLLQSTIIRVWVNNHTLSFSFCCNKTMTHGDSKLHVIKQYFLLRRDCWALQQLLFFYLIT